jgi:heterogeneous nuclear ribonucleoprotein A1/A3/nuclear pore complex protein Nup210
MESPGKDHMIGSGEQNDVGRAFNHRDEHDHEQQHHNSQPLTGDGASPG